MQKGVKEAIEQAVLKDVEYISEYFPRAVGAQSARHFDKMTIIKPVALNVYPQIYADMIKRVEPKEAIRRLKSMGLRAAKFYYSTFQKELKENRNFTEIFTDVAKLHLHEKIEFRDKVIEKENKQLKACIIEVKDCFFCSEITPFAHMDLPYCIPLAGLYENLYNIKSLYNKNLEPRLIQVTTMKSAEHDGDSCLYQLTVIE